MCSETLELMPAVIQLAGMGEGVFLSPLRRHHDASGKAPLLQVSLTYPWAHLVPYRKDELALTSITHALIPLTAIMLQKFHSKTQCPNFQRTEMTGGGVPPVPPCGRRECTSTHVCTHMALREQLSGVSSPSTVGSREQT